MNCHRCGAPAHDDAGFCPACGAVLAPNGPFGPAGPTGPPTSWPVPPQGAPAPGPVPAAGPGRGRRGLLVGLTVIAVIAVVAAAAVVVLPRLRDDADASRAAADIPDGQIVSMSGSDRLPWVSGQVDEPERAWSVEADEPLRPVIGEHHVFNLETRAGTPELVARALTDGTEAWATDLAPEGRKFLIGDQLVIVASEGRGVIAFDQGSGELAWAIVLTFDAFAALTRDDLLLLASAEQVVALRGDTGDQVWTSESTADLSAVTSDRVFTARDTQVRSLALADGAELWSTDLPDAATSLLLSGDRLVAHVGDELIALAADDGEQLWTTPVDTGDEGSVNVVSDATVVVTGDDKAVAIDSASGKPRSDDEFHLDDKVWNDSFGFRLTTGPVLLLAFEQNGWAQVVDGTTGDLIGRIDDDWPAVSATMLYAWTDPGLAAYRIADMEQQWTLDIDGRGVVVPGDDLIVVTTETGIELWT